MKESKEIIVYLVLNALQQELRAFSLNQKPASDKSLEANPRDV